MVEREKQAKGKERMPRDEKKEQQPKEKLPEGFRPLVRVAGVVLDGNRFIGRALMNIKGVGPKISRSVVRSLNLGEKTKLGTLSEKQVEDIEKRLQTLNQLLPAWMLNRQRDYVTGKSVHLLGPDLDITHREDINIQKKIKSYRGIRHSLNLPVRGQRTRTSFRTGTTIGVSRKKELAAAKKPEEKKK